MSKPTFIRNFIPSLASGVKTVSVAALACFLNTAALAETTTVPVKDFDIYVDQPTGFVFVKLPAGWKFVSRLAPAEMNALPGTVLTALLAGDEFDGTLIASQGQPQVRQ